MSAPSSSQPTSLVISAESSSKSIDTINDISLKDSEIEELKQQVALLIFNANALGQECKEWQTKYRSEKEEVFRLSGASAKQNRKIKALEDISTSLRGQLEEKEARAASLDPQVMKVIEWQTGQKEVYKEEIAQIRVALGTKDEKIVKLKGKLVEAKERARAKGFLLVRA